MTRAGGDTGRTRPGAEPGRTLSGTGAGADLGGGPAAGADLRRTLAAADLDRTLSGAAVGGGARRAAALAALGAAPFVAARLLYAPDETGVDGPALPCPFRELTGLPCPLCGATRAVAFIAHGDARFAEYGAVWVVVLAALVLAGLAALLTRRRLPSPPTLPVVAATTAAAWAYALAHDATIAP